jgi:excinuclease ABC subunit A
MAKKKGTSSAETAAAKRSIELRGATQHNLKGLDIDFPIGQLIVICGVSGSGKSSLAFDTLYAEGQRRYIESFSAYTRQFLQRLDKPKFERLDPLPPSIAVTRDARSRNNRSTVGTASEILEYLRLAFANRAELFCYQCGVTVIAHTASSILESLKEAPNARCLVGFEIQWQTQNDLAMLLADLQSTGFVRLVVNGKSVHLAETERSQLAEVLNDQNKALVVVDRLSWQGTIDERWTQSVQTSLDQALLHETAKVVVLCESSTGNVMVDGKIFQESIYSPFLRCETCAIDFPDANTGLFNFNHPIGACPSCEGFGETVAIDQDKVIPDRSLSLLEGAIAPWRTPSYSHELEELLALAKDFGIPTTVPVEKLQPKHWKIIQEGVPERNFGGLKGFFAWLERKKYKMHVRVFLSRWRSYSKCAECDGKRLSKLSLSYKLDAHTFADICAMEIDTLIPLLSNDPVKTNMLTISELDVPANSMWLAAESHSQYNASEPQRQSIARLQSMQQVGLGYLTLDRPIHTLSSGEAQRVNLTSLLGSDLVDMLYVFDEPTVGLHPQDVNRVANSILQIRDRGNTVILVEHEPAMMHLADRILEIGPEAGSRGGRVVFDGTVETLLKSKSTTARYLRGDSPRAKAKRRSDQWLSLRGASGRNLQVPELRLPIGCFTAVSGPSGSGKSSLLLETLTPAIDLQLSKSKSVESLPYQELVGVEYLTGCQSIDQSPIPRSARSTPATYCKAMDAIREAFVSTADARNKKMNASHFSFNSEHGRCPTCEGLGTTTVEMQFMADIQLPCSDCDGKRFRSEVLEVRYRDRTIHEVLQMSVEESFEFFRGDKDVQERLRLLIEIGLGYLPLGQSLSTLSAGESTRLKLASLLAGTSSVRSGELIVLDEPTTGLHFIDVDRLLDCLDLLLARGNTVVVIEHNEQLIEAADYVVEMGPMAGPYGGKVVRQDWCD